MLQMASIAGKPAYASTGIAMRFVLTAIPGLPIPGLPIPGLVGPALQVIFRAPDVIRRYVEGTFTEPNDDYGNILTGVITDIDPNNSTFTLTSIEHTGLSCRTPCDFRLRSEWTTALMALRWRPAPCEVVVVGNWGWRARNRVARVVRRRRVLEVTKVSERLAPAARVWPLGGNGILGARP
jgi:hypothetical protein